MRRAQLYLPDELADKLKSLSHKKHKRKVSVPAHNYEENLNQLDVNNRRQDPIKKVDVLVSLEAA